MNVFLTGATGFVGSYVLRALLRHGHTVRCLVRDLGDPLDTEGEGFKKIKGDVTSPRSLTGAMEGCDAAVHLVGLIDEDPSKGLTFENVHYWGTVHVVDEARRAGVQRFIQMSANGARPASTVAYQTTKWRAEQYVRQAGFEHWTIFRPSIAFGDPGPGRIEFASRLARTLVKPFPLLPVFGDGSYALQPVSVEEVAEAFAQALERAAAHEQVYCAAGRDTYRYTDVLDRIARGLGLRPKPKVPIPLWLARPLVHALGPLGLLPISPPQFEMLLEGNTCDESAFYRDFDLTYKPFTPEALSYLRQRV